MDLTRRIRSLLADPRRGLAGALPVMALVLVAVGVHVLCSVHLDEHPHGTGPAYGVVAPHGQHGTVSHHAVVVEAAAAVEASVGPLDQRAHGCSEHGTVTAQWDPVRPLPQGPAVVPVLAVQWPVPATAHHDRRVSSGVAAVAAPSLHALGISRT